MQKKKIIVGILLLLIILVIIALLQVKTKQMPNTMQEMANSEYTTTIGETQYEITNAVLQPSEIIPTLSAGMIPVKWNGEYWVITPKDDWYDYSKGKPAYIMLNDGYYKSELEIGISEEQLASNSVGASIARPEDLRVNIYVDATICI